MKTDAAYFALGWLLLGTSVCFADSGTAQLIGNWIKVVKIDAHSPKSDNSAIM